MKHKALLLFMTIAFCIPLQAQYEGLVVKMDYFNPAMPKEKQHIEMLQDLFTNQYLLTVSTTKTIYSNGSTRVRGGVIKTKHHYRSKTTTDTIINLSKEVFNELIGDCYIAVSTFITKKMKTSSYDIVDGSHPTITLSISNGLNTMEFLFKCPICPQDNQYDEQFREILAKIINHSCLDSEKILGICE